MTDKLVIGAPSLLGRDARDGLDKRLGGVSFPLTCQATNHFPFPVSFPVAGKLYMQPSRAQGSHGEATFASADVLKRFIADVQQICELRQLKEGVTIALPGSRKSSKPDPKPAPKPDPASE